MIELDEVIKNNTILESIENYSLIEDLPDNAPVVGDDAKVRFSHNEHFWRKILSNPQEFWNKEIIFSKFSFSEWIPRIPGLGFTIESRNISYQLRFAEPIERKNRIYRPSDKSRFVSSGIGSVKFPPDYAGFSVCAITSNQRSCQGIPVLLSPDVRDFHKLQNGDVIESITGIWQKMSHDWIKYFALTEKLPRGYLIVDDPKNIKVGERNGMIIYDPCSIMEYMQDDVFKWDYVFCSVSSADKDQIENIQEFFESYKLMGGINGKYLINPDIAEPIFETVYTSPNELKSNYAISQFALMKERMVKRVVEGFEIDQLTRMISQAYDDAVSLRTFAKRVGISGNLIEDDSPLKMAIQLVYLAIQSNLILELIQRFTIEHL